MSQRIAISTITGDTIFFKTKKTISSLAQLLRMHPPNASNEIELGNFIYEIDSFDLDIGPYKLITSVDTAINGFSQAINKISSLEDNISLITSTGNLFLFQIALGATGLNSQVINMTGSTGFESLDMKYVEFLSGSKYGTLSGIRQGFWAEGFSINAKEGFTMDGIWLGGMTIKNTRIINTGNFVLQGTSALRLRDVRTNMNVDVQSGSTVFDFSFDNFISDQGFQAVDGTYKGSGAVATSFTGGDSLDIEKSRKSFFKGNVGNLSKNSRIGGLWKCSSEVVTTLTLNTITKLEGNTTYFNMQHLTGINNNEFVQSDTNDITYSLDGEMILDAGPNVEIRLTIRKFDFINQTYINLEEKTKTVSNVLGGRDIVTFRPFVPLLTLLENDRIELWVTNLTNNVNVTMLLDSFAFLNKL